MRIINSIKNITFGIGSQITSTVLAFITRSIFVHSLGVEYLGINGLFSNILSILSLANLGFGSAIVFSLYRPIKENNLLEIKGYMNIYKKVYSFIGIFIFVIGLMLIPFLPRIINGEVNIKENIILIYVLFLIDSSISYFYAYKQSILVASQKNYIISKIHMYIIVISNILQIGILLMYKEYLLVLGIQLLFRFIENRVISRYADKEFPFLIDKNINGKLSETKLQELYKNVYSMFLYKISGTIINSTDNIVISYFIGVIPVAIYSNYLLVISTLNTFLSYIFSSITASVGDLVASNNDNKKKFIFDEIFFLSFWMYGFCSIGLYVLLNDFIYIWVGEEYILDKFTVIVLIINFYTAGMQSSSTTYRDTTGLFSIGKYRPIIAAILNLSISVILAPRFKIAGVILGTIVSRILVYFWFDPYVIHKYIFNESVKTYFLRYVKYSVLLLFTSYITEITANLIKSKILFMNFTFKCTVCILVPNILFVVVFSKSEYFMYIVNILKSIISKKKTKQAII